jgi:hypothetical protein
VTDRDQERRAGIARVRRELAQASGRRRLDLLLDAPDPGAVVRALPADELWFAIREAGLADAAEIVQLASPEQFKVFLDLEAWRGDEPDTRRALPWLRAARAGAASDEAGQRRWAAKLGALDQELLHLVLVDAVRVHDLEHDPDPHLESDRFLRTPEGRFVVEFAVEGADYAAVRGLLDDLLAEDPFRAARRLTAVRWELRSELAEAALRWRAARLQDLGYPPLDEALSWFAKPAAAPARRAGLPARAPGFFLQPIAPGSLLERAAAGLPEAAGERLRIELVAAANAVLVADRVDVEDLEAVRASMAAARALVELGLEEVAAGGDPAAALAATPVKRLFQAGFGRVLALRWRAERLLASGAAGTRDRPLLDPPLDAVVAELVRKRPRFAPGALLDRSAWGGPEAAVEAPRPFLSPADLAAASAALDAAEGLAALAGRLGLGDPGGRPERVRLAGLWLTALANERRGRGFRAAPVPRAEAGAAARAVADPADPRLEGEAGALLASLARRRAEELAPVAAGDVPAEALAESGALWVE